MKIALKSKVSPSKEFSRLNIRLLPDAKLKISRAAHIMGQDLTEFASNILSREAQEIIENHQQILLSEKDYNFFIDALDRPAQKPSNRSLKALEAYKRIFAKDSFL